MNEIIRTENAITYTNKTLNKATARIFKIGDTVRKCAFETAAIIAAVNETECYKDDGFKSVHEWAMKTFGFKKSTSYNLLKIGNEYTEQVKSGARDVYRSNLLPADSDNDFTTTQIQLLFPVGHETALSLACTGEIYPEMTCKEISNVVKKYTKDETEEAEEAETKAEEMEEAENASGEWVKVTDCNGNWWIVPADVLNKYKAEE